MMRGPKAAMCVVMTECALSAVGLETLVRTGGTAAVCWRRWSAAEAMPPLPLNAPFQVVGTLPEEVGALAMALMRLGLLLRQAKTASVARPVQVVLLSALPARWVMHTLARLVGDAGTHWSLQVLPDTASTARVQAAITAMPTQPHASPGLSGLTYRDLDVLMQTFWRRSSREGASLPAGSIPDERAAVLRTALAALGECSLRGGWHWRARRAWLPGYPPPDSRFLRDGDVVRYTRRGSQAAHRQPAADRAPLDTGATANSSRGPHPHSDARKTGNRARNVSEV